MPRAALVAIVMGAALAGLGLDGGTAWAQAGCAYGDALRDARLLEQADTEYNRVAAGATSVECGGAAGVDEDRKEAEELLQLATELHAAGLQRSDPEILARARDRYAETLALDASLADARAEFVRLARAGTGDPCADAAALERARLLGPAAALLKGRKCARESSEITARVTAAEAAVERGEALEAAGDPAGARDAYVLAASDASLDDARTRLAALVTNLRSGPCAGANALFEARLLGPAREAYAELQKEPNSPPCAATGAANTREAQKAAAKLLDEGKDLEKEDRIAAAREKYQQAADQDASLDEARDRLEDVAGVADPAPERIASWFTEDAGPWIGWGVALLLAIGLVVTLLLRIPAVKRRVNRWIWDVHEGTSAADLGPSQRRRRSLKRYLLALDRWALRVGLEVKDFGTTDRGKAVAKALQAHLARVGSRRTRTVDVVAAPFPASGALSELAEAVKTVPQGKIWGALMSMISRALPRETLTLSGQLLDTPSRTGLSLSIAKANGTVVEAVTLWADEFEEEEPADADQTGNDKPTLDEASVRLAIAGAVWTAYAFLEYRHVLKPSEWRQYLDTSRWRSYALVQMGSARRPDDDPRDLLALYVRARDEDPENLGAVFNLAVARLRLEDSRTRALLERLERKLPTAAERPFEPLRYQVAYQRGALAVHEHYGPRRVESAGYLEPCRKSVGTQLAALEETLQELLEERGDRRDGEEQDRTAELRRLEGPLVVLWAVLAHLAPQATTSATVTTRQDFAKRLSDGTMTAGAAVEWLCGQTADLSERTHYNLACYYGADPETHGKALEHLAQGTHTAALYKWANDDPSLTALRTAEPDAFEKALAFAHPESEPRTGLGAIDSIGDHAARLATVRIDRPRQLADRARRPDDRLVLAGRLEVSPLLVERWARLCEVKYRLGVSDDELNLLDRASAGSIGVLRLQSSDELQQLLKRVSVNGVPAPDKLADWIAEAQREPEWVQPPLA